MKQLIAIVIVVAIAVAGYYYYTGKTFPYLSPSAAYQAIVSLPSSQQGQALQATVSSWVKDPSLAIPYPPGWKKEPVTVNGETFNVVTPDTSVPPQYYVSFSFPKNLISSMHLIKCLGTSSTMTTDMCVVGDNPEIDAYYKILGWINSNPFTSSSSSSATTAS